MYRIIILGLALGVLFPAAAGAGHEHPEKWYQERWCAEKGGEMEVVLPDRTRCDCLTATNAVELDFGPKWAEAIGQALYYSIQTGKRAGVVLILEKMWFAFFKKTIADDVIPNRHLSLKL